MLLRHSLYYLLARGLPSLLNFAALAVYTRLLAPDEFGRYALLIAGVGLANVFVFQWQRLVLIRFLPANCEHPQSFLGGILAQFLGVSLVVSGIGVALALMWPDPVWQRLLALAVPLLLTQAAFELSLTRASASLKLGWYGKLLGSKAVIALVVGGLLAWIGLGAAAPVVGLILAHAVALLVFGWAAWQGSRPCWPSTSELRSQLAYGLPLTVTFALAWVISGSDRFLIAWLLDRGAVGIYAAAYDLCFPSLTALLTIINTAAHPLAVTALETRGADQARQQLEQNGELIIAAAMAGATCLVVLTPSITELVIGMAYRGDALVLLPWILAAAMLAGVKAYHFDIAFHLGRNSRWLVANGAIAALANVGLNLWLIPLHGLLGAAWATLGAYAIGLLSSMIFGRRVFTMPAAWPMFIKGGLVAVAAGLATWVGTQVSDGSWVGLGTGLLLGICGAISAMLIVDVSGTRTSATKVWRARLK